MQQTLTFGISGGYKRKLTFFLSLKNFLQYLPIDSPALCMEQKVLGPSRQLKGKIVNTTV